MKKSLPVVLSTLGILILILGADIALNGAKEGIRLCLMTVIPSLFPFIVLSILLTSSLTGLQAKLLRPVGRLCRMPRGTESLLVIGLLGGYPTGAQSVSQLYSGGQISKEQARRLLGFCSNAGPAFIFGICGSLFPEKWMVWLLWAVHILSALAVGAMLPGQQEGGTTMARSGQVSLTQALDRALKTTVSVCGWVILFRILIAFADNWFLRQLAPECKALFSGILELTNGCCQMSSIENSGIRFITTSVILSFGGLCVTMQTASVTGKLGSGCYLRGKVLQSGVSAILAITVQALFFPLDCRLHVNSLVILVPAVILILSLYLFEKKSSITELIGV